MKFFFYLHIYLSAINTLINNPDPCLLPYPYNHTTTLFQLHTTTLLLVSCLIFGSCCVRAHTEMHFMHFRFFRGGHLWLCYQG
jgi:hypothetical protein